MKVKIETIHEILVGQREEEHVVQWAKRLIDGDQDQASTLASSHRMFERAATRKVAISALESLDNGKTLDELRARMVQAVLTGARYPSFSTSPTENLMAQSILSAQALLVEHLR